MALSFDKVNKVITVLAPDTEITIQNLLDSIREFEDELTSMDIPKIASCAGKEPLGGGVVVGLTLTLLDDWQLAFEARSGPSYIQCTVSGGNIVAVNVNGSIYPTAFTQVLITASSSATQADLAAIQYASYQNAVWVDVNSTETGTAYPVYTRESPGNNIQDAVTVANERGFSTIQLLSDITLQTGDILTGFKLVGVSHILTNVTIETGAICGNLQISKCWVTGVLDGGTEIEDSIVSDLVYFNGHIHNCGLVGTVTLDGNKKAVFSDCKTIDQDHPLVLDMGGSGQSVAIPNYSGLLTIRNLSDATQEVGLGLNAGMVILDNTITAGTIIIGGNGILMHTQTGAEIVNSDGLMNKTGIASAVVDYDLTGYVTHATFGGIQVKDVYDDAVELDIINGVSGTSFPIGIGGHPVNNIPDAKAILAQYHLSKIRINDDVVIPASTNLNGITFIAGSTIDRTITIPDTATTRGTKFKDVIITGTLDGKVEIDNCGVEDLYNVLGNLTETAVSGTLSLNDSTGQLITLDACRTGGDGSIPILHINGAKLSIVGWTGSLNIESKTGSSVLGISTQAGSFNVKNTCTTGMIIFAGTGTAIVEGGTTSIVNSDNLLNKENIATEVLDSVA